MTNKPCVLVAEASVIDTLYLAVIGLQKYSDVNRIDVVVPDNQQKIFIDKLKGLDVNIIPETRLIGTSEILNIKQKLGNMSPRLGWYLQQFLKWEYRNICDADNYLIWDADTVLVRQNNFFGNDKVSFNMADEYHIPYFKTMERAFGLTKQVKKSFISQYMLINVENLNNLIGIVDINDTKAWFLSLLDNIEKTDQSEFSEYETYGTHIISRKHQLKVHLKKDKWFRYGSDVFKLEKNTDICQLEKKFSAYQYVAFERHSKKISRSIYANLKCFLRC